ncbi:MAG TPA: ATP-grasp domain-containing protein [Xanthobacteraceae bacterium]|nr:ATP-grasp domain-containing protein [Xanthobacteraceae bacterium]
MNFEEHVAKAKALMPASIPVPRGKLCVTPDEAAAAFAEIGPCVVKAQVPTGKRGKAGGIRKADSAAEAAAAATAILGMSIDGHRVERVLLEERAAIAREFYAAVLTDFAACRPLILFSTEGGMDIEEVAAARPHAVRRHALDIDAEFTDAAAHAVLAGTGLGAAAPKIAAILKSLYAIYRARDAELIEINPLALLNDGRVVALDCKLVLDDAALFRQGDLAGCGAGEKLTALERRGAAAGLKFIELDGNVGVLANGAGLTMTTMDVVAHFGGKPANFLEIGGEAYTKGEAALDLVLSAGRVKSLVINFCGAFARTDVMAEGVVKAWQKLKPQIPVFFSIHGTGEDEAVKLVREGLGIEPYDFMEDAVRAAVEAAR